MGKAVRATKPDSIAQEKTMNVVYYNEMRHMTESYWFKKHAFLTIKKQGSELSKLSNKQIQRFTSSLINIWILMSEAEKTTKDKENVYAIKRMKGMWKLFSQCGVPKELEALMLFSMSQIGYLNMATK